MLVDQEQAEKDLSLVEKIIGTRLCSLGLSLANYFIINTVWAFNSHSYWIGRKVMHLKLKQDESII